MWTPHITSEIRACFLDPFILDQSLANSNRYPNQGVILSVAMDPQLLFATYATNIRGTTLERHLIAKPGLP